MEEGDLTLRRSSLRKEMVLVKKGEDGMGGPRMDVSGRRRNIPKVMGIERA